MTSYGNNSIMTSNNGTSNLQLIGSLLINPSLSSTIIGIQFGSVEGANGTIYTSFNYSFPSEKIFINASANGATGSNLVNLPVISSVTKDGFNWTPYYGNNGQSGFNIGGYTITWIAICYA